MSLFQERKEVGGACEWGEVIDDGSELRSIHEIRGQSPNSVALRDQDLCIIRTKQF